MLISNDQPLQDLASSCYFVQDIPMMFPYIIRGGPSALVWYETRYGKNKYSYIYLNNITSDTLPASFPNSIASVEGKFLISGL